MDRDLVMFFKIPYFLNFSIANFTAFEIVVFDTGNTTPRGYEMVSNAEASVSTPMDWPNIGKHITLAQ